MVSTLRVRLCNNWQQQLKEFPKSFDILNLFSIYHPLLLFQIWLQNSHLHQSFPTSQSTTEKYFLSFMPSNYLISITKYHQFLLGFQDLVRYLNLVFKPAQFNLLTLPNHFPQLVHLYFYYFDWNFIAVMKRLVRFLCGCLLGSCNY